MEINGQKLGRDCKPFIIAELSANHAGSINIAKQSMLEAKRCGVDAIKIQSYTPDTMTIECNKPDFQLTSGLWTGSSLYELYKRAHTPFEWHEELFKYAAEIGITLFSTPFDETAVDLLENLNTPAYKIASFELTDLPLIKYIAQKNKPILMSTGMGSLEEIAEALKIIREFSQNNILLFHCISSYPTPTQQSNLSNIRVLSKEFGVEIGLSDHTISNLAATVAVGIGAVAIEKHFKLNETDCGPDSSFSLTPAQLSTLVKDCNDAWLAKGQDGFFRADVESENKIFRRSLYFINDLPLGEIISSNDVKRIRPGYGLAPKYLSEILGKKLTRAVERGDPVSWDCIFSE